MILLILITALLQGSAAEEGLYWVIFSDRGADVEQRLEIASVDIMSGPSAERRIASGTAQADVYDLPPFSEYIEEVEVVSSRSIRTSSRYLNAVSVILTTAQIEILLAEPFVREIRPVGVSTFTPEEDIPAPDGYGLSRSQLEQVNILALHQRGWTGSGVVIGMLDSGFELVHPCLQSVDVLGAWDFVNNDSIVGWQAEDSSSLPSHGTKTLSVIAGYSPGSYVGGSFNSSFLLAKTEDVSDEYEQEEDFWVAGLEWLETGGADLVSSSLGYTDWYEPSQMDGNTAVTTIAADLAASRGMVVWNSAGNDGPGETSLVAPADGDSVFAVGAVDGSGTIASFSSRGPTADGRIKPDGCARGLNSVFATYNGTGYSTGGGTSFAAPLVASAAACIASAHPDWGMMRVYEALKTTSDRFSNPDNTYGYGIINALEAVKHRSIIGQVRRSDTGDPLTQQTVQVTMGTCSPIHTTTNEMGFFAIEPGVFGSFTATSTGWGNPIPYSGYLDENGIEITIYVDPVNSSASSSVYPNPSSSGFYIGFDVVNSISDVSLSIFTLANDMVYFEERISQSQGCYRAPIPGQAFFWNGLNKHEEPVASGQYIGLLRIGDSVELLNLALIRGMEEE
ncbi:MAG: S8 family serine peptidase [Candidatus Sabulitectum sp.]|nr:S8 family serine peptidase [Candidatus Sabulitectum sp.]